MSAVGTLGNLKRLVTSLFPFGPAGAWMELDEAGGGGGGVPEDALSPFR